MRTSAWIGLFGLAATAACNFGPQYCEGDPVTEEAPPSTTEARVVAQVLPVESTAVDILFVIDDSSSMTDEQEQLGIWSSEMFDVLSSSSGELPDLHIAVTSSSVAIDGIDQCATTAGLHVGSAMLQNGSFLTDVAGPTGRVRNYSGKLTDTFAKMARVGDAGCGFEQPFKAAQLALAGYMPGSKGFLRDDALLLVVFVTDEDDCSSSDSTLFTDPYADACTDLGPLTSYRCFEKGVVCHDGKGNRAFGDRKNCRPDDTARYEESIKSVADFIKGFKKDPAQVIVAGIYGKPNHIAAVPDERITSFTTPRLANVCGTGGKEGSGATPAVRLNAFLAQFGGRASQSSICESELSWAMRDVGLVTRSAATRSHCLRGAMVDTDAAAPGVQPSCHVEVASDVGTPQETRIGIPRCDRSGGERCYTIDTDAACSETETGLAFRLDDGAARETMIVTCDVDVAADLRPSIGETRADE